MGFLDQKVTDRFAIYNGDSMEIGLNMGQIPPDWEWTDAFGDTMQFNRAGENVVLTVVRRRDGDDYDHACVSLNPAQQRALRAALFGIGTKRREQNFGPDIRTD